MTAVFLGGGNLEELYPRYLKLLGRKITPMPAVLRAECGKPYFECGDIHFSIAHTDKGGEEVKLTAFSLYPVGVDVEAYAREVDYIKIAERFFPKKERPKTAKEFLEIFTRKEAYIKMTGGTLAAGIETVTPKISKNYDVLPGMCAAVSSKEKEIMFLI